MAPLISEKWINKRILITGHTGFKGVWLTFLLRELGAQIFGLSLPASEVNKFYLDLGMSKFLEDEYFVDLSCASDLQEYIERIRPDFIFHLAGQALVIEGIADPVKTFSTNVMGTSNLLDAVLKSDYKTPGICVITTDKVYAASGKRRPFKESDKLGGTDPYSASKVGTEMVVSGMHSMFKEREISISIARAGNVIGGGDWGKNRLLPDLIISHIENSKPIIRNPKATRPFQHVLDCLWGYILLANNMGEESSVNLGIYNFGPNSSLRVEEVVGIYEGIFQTELSIEDKKSLNFERQRLNLNSDKAKSKLQWKPYYKPREAIAEALHFYQRYLLGEDLEIQTRLSIEKWFRLHD